MLTPVKNKNISEQIDNFKDFLVKYKIPIICSFIFSFICFGFMLTNHSLTIDEETWINSSDTGNTWLWLRQGRFGIFLIDQLLAPAGNYTPFLWDFLSVLIWNFSGICFLFCISMFYQKFNKFSLFVFCAYFSSLPFVVGEILAYSMFNFQQSLAMLCMAISVFFTYNYFTVKRTKFLIISSILLFISISFYQAFMVLYIVMIIAYGLIAALKHNNTNIIITNMVKATVSFLLGVLAYYVVNKVITTFIAPDSGNYLSAYVGWNKGNSSLDVIRRALINVKIVLFGDPVVYGGKVIFTVTCLFLIYSIISSIITKGIIRKVIIIIMSILLLISPFALSISLGTASLIGRTYLALPLAGAIELFLVNNLFNKKGIFKSIITIVTVFILLFNSMYMNRLFYDSFIVYQYDRTVGNQIMHDIGMQGFDYNGKPIIFIGKHDINRKIISASSGSNGGSFFSWDDGNNTRIINFLRSEGYDTSMPSPSQIRYGYGNSKDLLNWPNKNSIKELNGCIVVKLSDVTQVWLHVNGI